MAAYFMLMWCGDTGSLSRCMPVRGEHVGAHGELWAKLGKPATKMAHTYQIQIQYSAFSEITYDNSTKYWPTVLGIFLSRPNKTVYWHSFRQTIYFGPKPIKGFPSRSGSKKFCRFVEKSWKNLTTFRLWTLRSSYPIMVINDKNKLQKIPTSHSPTVALVRWRH